MKINIPVHVNEIPCVWAVVLRWLLRPVSLLFKIVVSCSDFEWLTLYYSCFFFYLLLLLLQFVVDLLFISGVSVLLVPVPLRLLAENPVCRLLRKRVAAPPALYHSPGLILYLCHFIYSRWFLYFRTGTGSCPCTWYTVLDYNHLSNCQKVFVTPKTNTDLLNLLK